MSSRKILLAGASLLALTSVLAQNAQAFIPPCLETQGTITGSCSGPVTLTGDLVVASTGTVVAISSTALINAIHIGALSNQGVISGSLMGAGINNSGSIGALSNIGAISGTSMDAGIRNSGSIGVLTNDGLIDIIGKPGAGILNFIPGATITTLINTGTIQVQVTNTIGGTPPYTNGIRNWALIGELINEGLIDVRGTTAVGIASSGSIGTLSNSGMISADGQLAYGIANNSIGSITELQLSNGGKISAVGGFAYGVANAGNIEQLSNSGEISVRGSTSANGFGNIGSIGTLSNSGVIDAQAKQAYGIGNHSSIGVLGSIGKLSNSGQIIVKGSTAYGIDNTGSIGQLSNSGEISAVAISGVTSSPFGGLAIGIGNNGGIEALTNTGTINAKASHRATGIYNGGSIGALTSSGVISAESDSFAYAINNKSTITSLTIDVGGSVSASGAGAIGVANGFGLGKVMPPPTPPSITNLTNSGTITATASTGSAIGIGNDGSIGTLSNSGQISADAHGSAYAINNTSTITSLTIDVGGSVSAKGAYAYGIANTGTIGSIGTFSNSGKINAAGLWAWGIANGNGSGVNELNNRGEITAAAIDGTGLFGGTAIGIGNSGGIEALTNTGKINAQASHRAAGISNTGSIGTLTSKGVISAEADVSAAAINNGSTITSLTIDVGGSASAHGAIAYGIINSGAIDTLTNRGSIAATGGSAIGLNNFGNIGALSNSGTIHGDSYAILNTGTLDTIGNSGAIDGNISSDKPLAITGGSGAVMGTLTGGSITAPDVAFTAGNLLVDDNIVANAGAGTVANTGAALNLYSIVTITGNYSQTSGILTLGPHTELIVSGSASITGGTISSSAIGNYFAGDVGSTLISAAGGLTYTGTTFSSGLGGVNASVSVVNGTDLVETFLSNYVGGTLPALTISGNGPNLVIGQSGTITSLNNTGTITGGQSAVINGGTIGSFGNDGTIFTPGGLYGLQNSGTIGTFTNTGTITGSQFDIYNSGSIGTFLNSGHIGSPVGVEILAGGSIANLNNSGVISGTQYAIYNAGTLGVVTNSGTIDGNIFSANALTIAGAGGSAYGTLTHGTITAPGVTFTSGNTRLQDKIVVNNGTGTVINSGANLRLDSAQTITGKYSQTGGSLVIDVASATSYGSLVVSGSATVTNSAINLTGSGLAYGQTFTVVSGGAASSYTGDTVNAGSFFALLSQTGNNLTVMLGLPFKSIGNSVGGDAQVMGGILEPLQSNSGFASTLTALGGVTTAAQGNALKQMAPAQVGGGAAVLQRGMLMTGQIDQAIGQRASLAQANDHGWSLWGQMMGGLAKRGAKGAVETYGISSWGLAMGADTRLRDSLVIGGAMSWGLGWNGGTGVLAANTNSVNSYQLTAYGSWSRGALTVTGQTALGFDSYDQHRVIDVTSQTARTSYDGHHYEMAASGGYAIAMDKLTLTPTASLKWLRVDTDGYTESGAGFFNLSVNATSQDQVESGLGFKLGSTFDTSLGVLEPELKAMWLHDFVYGVIATDAAISGVSFATSAVRPGGNGFELGAGLTLYHAGDLSLRVSYDGEFRGGYTAHTGQMQIKLAL